MNRNTNSTNLFVGLLLVGGGVLFLLSNLGLFQGFGSAIWSIIWMLAFAVGGAFFLLTFLRDYRTNWWAAIPGMTLLGLALSALFDNIVPGLSGLSGPIFLASIGGGFVLVYIAVPENWWAIIPAGVMLTLGAVAGVDEAGIGGFGGDFEGTLFFFGLGATFLVLALLPNTRADLRWAFIPALVMIVLGLFVAASLDSVINYIWPVALIGGGLYMLLRGVSHRQVEAEPRVPLKEESGEREVKL